MSEKEPDFRNSVSVDVHDVIESLSQDCTCQLCSYEMESVSSDHSLERLKLERRTFEDYVTRVNTEVHMTRIRRTTQTILSELGTFEPMHVDDIALSLDCPFEKDKAKIFGSGAEVSMRARLEQKHELLCEHPCPNKPRVQGEKELKPFEEEDVLKKDLEDGDHGALEKNHGSTSNKNGTSEYRNLLFAAILSLSLLLLIMPIIQNEHNYLLCIILSIYCLLLWFHLEEKLFTDEVSTEKKEQSKSLWIPPVREDNFSRLIKMYDFRRKSNFRNIWESLRHAIIHNPAHRFQLAVCSGIDVAMPLLDLIEGLPLPICPSSFARKKLDKKKISMRTLELRKGVIRNDSFNKEVANKLKITYCYENTVIECDKQKDSGRSEGIAVPLSCESVENVFEVNDLNVTQRSAIAINNTDDTLSARRQQTVDDTGAEKVISLSSPEQKAFLHQENDQKEFLHPEIASVNKPESEHTSKDIHTDTETEPTPQTFESTASEPKAYLQLTTTAESEIQETTRGITKLTRTQAKTIAEADSATDELSRVSANAVSAPVHTTKKYATSDSRLHVGRTHNIALETQQSVEKENISKDNDDSKVLRPRSDAGESQNNDYVEVIRELTHLPVGQNTVPTDAIILPVTGGRISSASGSEANSLTDASTEEGSRAGTSLPESSTVHNTATAVPSILRSYVSEGSISDNATAGTSSANSSHSNAQLLTAAVGKNSHSLEMDGSQGNRSQIQAIANKSLIVEGGVMTKSSVVNGIVPETSSSTNNRIVSKVPENNSVMSEASSENENQSLQCTDNCDTPEVLATNTITAESSDNTRHSITSEVSVDRDLSPEATSIVTDTSAETQPSNTELDRVLQRMARGEEIGPRITMRFELLRLCTMRNYPKINKPWIIRLAAAGFYYAADGDEVICYCCGIRRRNWTAEEIPMDVHRRTSPKCSFIVNNEEVNVRVPREENNSERPDRFANLQELLEPVPEGSGRQTGRDGDMSVPAITQVAQQNVGSSSSSSSSTGTARQDRPNYNLNRTPKHPHYGAYNVRLNSFIGWPSSSPQTPATLAEAGFYYAGMGDCVRCYHCSVGLRHWAAEDDPWIEHGRWTLENPCWYLVQKRGEEFLELIRMALQITDNQPPSANTSTPSESAPTDTQHLEGTPAPTARSRHVGAGRQSGKPVDSTSVVARGGNSSNTQMRKSNSCGIQSGNISSQPKTASGEMSQKGGSSAKLKQLKTENQQLRRQTLCHVCEERDVCIVFLPCGHLVTCSECAPQLRVCPVCNKVVKGTVRTYMS